MIPAPGAPDSGSVWIRASLLASSSGQNNAAGRRGTVHSLCLDPTRVVGTSTGAGGVTPAEEVEGGGGEGERGVTAGQELL